MIGANRGYRSNWNEALLRERMLVSRFHKTKPYRPMPVRTATFVGTIGLARATVTIGLANLVYNMCRLGMAMSTGGTSPSEAALRSRR